MTADGSSTALVLRPPYPDGFPGADAVSIAPVQSKIWAWVTIVVGSVAAGANLVAGAPRIAIGLLILVGQGAYLLWQSGRPQPPFVGPMGVDFGRWGVGWERVSRYADGYLHFDPPIDVGRRITTFYDLSRKVRLYRFDNDRAKVEDALRTFRPELLHEVG